VVTFLNKRQRFTAKGAKYAKKNQEFFAYFAPFAVKIFWFWLIQVRINAVRISVLYLFYNFVAHVKFGQV